MSKFPVPPPPWIDGRLWQRRDKGQHQLIILPSQRLTIICAAHDDLGHKGVYSTRRFLADQFWWPSLDSDVKWFIETCHECQLHQEMKVRIHPTITTPAPLFQKAYIDTMHMTPAGGFHAIVQARCSLPAWPEWHALRTETGHTLSNFIFKEIFVTPQPALSCDVRDVGVSCVKSYQDFSLLMNKIVGAELNQI